MLCRETHGCTPQEAGTHHASDRRLATAPIAIELAPVINGNRILTAVCVIATRMIGAMLGPWLMNIVGIYDPLARGLALGTISHGQGIAQAVIEGELQGAAAGIAMSLAAAFTSCIARFLVPFLV